MFLELRADDADNSHGPRPLRTGEANCLCLGFSIIKACCSTSTTDGDVLCLRVLLTLVMMVLAVVVTELASPFLTRGDSWMKSTVVSSITCEAYPRSNLREKRASAGGCGSTHTPIYPNHANATNRWRQGRSSQWLAPTMVARSNWRINSLPARSLPPKRMCAVKSQTVRCQIKTNQLRENSSQL